MSIPIDLDREAAQEAAREELAKQIYKDAGPGLTERLVRWLYEQAVRLLDGAAGVSPGGRLGLAVVLLLLLAAAVVIRMRVGPFARRGAADQPLFVGQERTAAEHRAAADAHTAAGEWADALRERLRAVVRDLEERAILEPRLGRTADEAAAEAGAALPSCAAGLRQGARTFDEVWYGGRTATAEHDAAFRELDRQVRAARPSTAGAPR